MNEIFQELGVSGGTALIVLLALYFVIKWAVKNGVREALDIPYEMQKQFIKNMENKYGEEKEDTKENNEEEDLK